MGREGGTRVIGPNCLRYFNPAQIQVAVLDKLEELVEDPRPAACEKVKELAQYGVFRVKVPWA